MAQVSSVGELGIAARSDERMYFNYPELVTEDNLDEFQAEMDAFLPGKDYGDEFTRSVVRAVFDAQVMERLFSRPANYHRSEAATPLPADGDETSDHLVYFANNRGRRHNSSTYHHLNVNAVKSARYIIRAQVQAAESSPLSEIDSGAEVVDYVEDPAQLLTLWEETFGWDLEGCQGFASAVDANLAETQSANRKLWFKGIKDLSGILVAAAMAERLDMPSSNSTGRISLIEHTEWSALPNQRGRGLGKRVVRSLTETLKTDLEGQPHQIFAECNILSGAHIVALRSGFEVPTVVTKHGEIGQVLHSNVRIGDGLEPKGEYRNFMFTTVV